MTSAYRERPPIAALTGTVACTWTRDAGGSAHVQRVVPDACMDILWWEGRLELVGPDTRPVLTPLRADTTIVGLRFAPGYAPAFLGVPAAALTDERVALDALWGRGADGLRERLAAAADAPTAERILEDAVAARASRLPATDGFAAGLFALVTAPNDTRVRDMADELGVGERQLHRRCGATVGYGPKMLDRVLRFQRFLRTARRTTATFAALAAECGYADEAHLSRECRALGGLPPGGLVERRVQRQPNRP